MKARWSRLFVGIVWPTWILVNRPGNATRVHTHNIGKPAAAALNLPLGGQAGPLRPVQGMGMTLRLGHLIQA